jgi:hypothetical protein
VQPNSRSIILGQTYRLADGGRVRLRICHSHDGEAILRLLDRLGLDAERLELGRLLRFDPRRRVVACATTLIDGSEALVALGAIEIGEAPVLQPELLLVDERLDQSGRELFFDAIVGWARSTAQRHAA